MKSLQKPSVKECFWAFLRLGLTSFGGPVAHLGFLREEFVNRRKWLTEYRLQTLRRGTTIVVSTRARTDQLLMYQKIGRSVYASRPVRQTNLLR